MAPSLEADLRNAANTAGLCENAERLRLLGRKWLDIISQWSQYPPSEAGKSRFVAFMLMYQRHTHFLADLADAYVGASHSSPRRVEMLREAACLNVGLWNRLWEQIRKVDAA